MWEKIMRRLWLASFLLVIYGGLIAGILYPDKTLSASENRALAQLPVWSRQAVLKGRWGQAWERYMNDQFPGRELFISAKSRAEYWQGKKDSNGVYFGSNQYLLQKLEPPQPGRVEKNLQGLQKFLEKHPDYQATLCLIPTSAWILQDKLPQYAQPIDEEKIIRQTQNFIDALPRASFVETRHVLANHRQEALYFRTDHHYTMLGAYYVYVALGTELGYQPLPLSAFRQQVVSSDFYGTLYARGLFNWLPKDEIRFFQQPKLQAKRVVMDDGSVAEGFYDDAKLQTPDQYAFFLGGNYGYLKITTDIKNGKKLYLVKDSFANAITPFLANHYEEIHLFDLRYYRVPFNQIISEKNCHFLFFYGMVSYLQENSVYQIQYL